MKTTIFAVCFLCFLCATTAAFGQNTVNSEIQPLRMADHPQHAAQHEMAAEANLFGASPYSYAKGEVPLAELASPIYHTPLGDIAREYKKEHANQPKASKTMEN